MNEIKGAAGQHAFIILETESTDGRTDFDQQDKPEIEVKDLANILSKLSSVSVPPLIIIIKGVCLPFSK